MKRNAATSIDARPIHDSAAANGAGNRRRLTVQTAIIPPKASSHTRVNGEKYADVGLARGLDDRSYERRDDRNAERYPEASPQRERHERIDTARKTVG